jgi:hypothetical protein
MKETKWFAYIVISIAAIATFMTSMKISDVFSTFRLDDVLICAFLSFIPYIYMASRNWVVSVEEVDLIEGQNWIFIIISFIGIGLAFWVWQDHSVYQDIGYFLGILFLWVITPVAHVIFRIFHYCYKS